MFYRDGVATGVEYIFDKRVYENSPQDVRTVKARLLVVVAGGAMGSPLILERSGIGRKDLLEKVGIPVIVELPGVGENYQGIYLLSHIYHITHTHTNRSYIRRDSIPR